MITEYYLLSREFTHLVSQAWVSPWLEVEAQNQLWGNPSGPLLGTDNIFFR